MCSKSRYDHSYDFHPWGWSALDVVSAQHAVLCLPHAVVPMYSTKAHDVLMYSTEEPLRPQFELTGMNKVSDERTAIMVWPEGLDDSVDEDGSHSRRRDCHLAAPLHPY